MAKIDPELLERLRTKLGVTKRRIYALIQQTTAKHFVSPHLGALLLARDNGIRFQKYATQQDLNDLRGVANHPPVTVPLTANPPQHAQRAAERKSKAEKLPKTKENTVFVVHGRDNILRDEIFEFLGALGLKAQEWGHAIRAVKGQGANPYVNDAVTTIMKQAQAIVVMLSPDDEVKLKDQFIAKHERSTEGRLRGQARPNVIFETGIAIGTHHKKTVIVRAGDVKPFTDIGGMHILHLTDTSHSRNEFANRLENLGCKIDRTGDHWLRAGHFTPTGPKVKKANRRANSPKRSSSHS